MDIGGYDLIIETPLSREKQRDCALAYLRNYWPDGVLEEDGLKPGDFFFYKDAASKASWDEDYNEENCHDMVYVICEEGRVTFVHEGLDEEDFKNAFFHWNKP